MSILVSVDRMEAVWSPFRGGLWSRRPVRKREVRQAIEQKRFQRGPWSPRWTIEQHAERIAWLSVAGWNDAIQIDVGVPGFLDYLPHRMITDGNHRFAAAIIRKDRTILADVAGDSEYAFELLGITPDGTTAARILERLKAKWKDSPEKSSLI
jgi:hypothetical protein